MSPSPTPVASDIAIVIVTYKRSSLLAELLDSVISLTERPGRVVIVDNAAEVAAEREAARLRDALPDVDVIYEAQQKNTGGAGGFSRGTELAYEAGSEWLWLMDDDVALEPEGATRLLPWMSRFRVIQGRRYDYDGSPFYWQYRFNTQLGIPNPIADSTFDSTGYREMNTACFEGTIFHRSVVQQIGLPDPRFFIYWDDTVYGWRASQITKCVLVDEFVLRRTREIKQLDLGVRHLNGTSDMVRYHIMRNRGYMARYFALHGDLKRVSFAFGTFLTFGKELIRIMLIDHSFRGGIAALWRGVRDARTIRRDRSWTPMPALDQ